MSNLTFDSRLPAEAKKPYIDINDILYPKFVPDYLKSQIEEIEIQQQILKEKILAEGKPIIWGQSKEYDRLTLKAGELDELVKENYISQRSEGELLDDIRLIVNSFDKEYIESECLWYEGLLSDKETMRGASELQIEMLKDFSTPSYSNAYRIIESYLSFYLEYFNTTKPSKKNLQRIDEIVKARVSLWYVEPESSYLPVLQGRATNALAIMATRSALIVRDPISHSGKIRVGREGGEVIGIIKDDKLISKLGVGAHKLLMTAISIFTSNNHTGEKARQVKSTEVLIPLKEYAKKKGYKLDTQPTTTPEEAKREAQRVKNELKNARRAVEKDLEVLYNFSFQWKEKIRGKEEDLGERRVIDEYAIEGGYIKINIAKGFSEYLIRLPISQYPVALLSLAENQKNAYAIANFMSLHSNNDNNIRGGTSNLLKVKTLLSYTNLPSIEDVKKKRKSWTERIKEPLEKALDSLGVNGCNLLEDWEYTHSKGVPLTDKEASALINDYYIWEETLVKYTLKEAPDHRDRLEAKAQRIGEAQTKKTAKKKTKTDS